MSALMSAIGGKADIAIQGLMSANDPKRTWAWRLEPRRVTRGQANLLVRELPQTGDRVLMRAS